MTDLRGRKKSKDRQAEWDFVCCPSFAGSKSLALAFFIVDFFISLATAQCIPIEIMFP
jgi:hypothetical protein